MEFEQTLNRAPALLTEGAVIERLKRETGLAMDPHILNAGLIYDPAGRRAMADLYAGYMAIASTTGLPMLTMAPTWRANPERLKAAGGPDAARVNADAIDFLRKIRQSPPHETAVVFVGGLMACRGDAYRPQEALSTEAAHTFHRPQAEALAEAGADFLMAATLPAFGEALGLARAMGTTGIPYLVSFVLDAHGHLLDGTPLDEAVARIDRTVSAPPVGYMANCVHPDAFAAGLEKTRRSDPAAASRLLGLQANTSALPPDQLNEREELDTMDPEAFARAMAGLHRRLGVRILGGCCGTDHRHIRALAERLSAAPTA